MNQYEQTPEETRKRLEDAARELEEHTKSNPIPTVPEDDDGVPTHELPNDVPPPAQIIEEENLGSKE